MDRRFVALASVLLAIGVIAASLALFSQNFPAVTAVIHVVSNCSSLAPTPTTIAAGSDGDITFSCSSSDPAGQPAFTTNDTIRIYAVITGFTSPYTTLYVYDADGAVTSGNCADRTAAQFINNHDPDDFTSNGWNYCARYHNATAAPLPAFSVQWWANANAP